jgi:serine/threonine protein kinase/WD40 repeat protein/tetratricopeptide (TPR) repeat protein
LKSEAKSVSEETRNREARVIGLAQEMCDRHRRGERPTLDEYAANYPELAAEIRELFPMLRMLEDLGPDRQEAGAAAVGLDAGALRQLGEYRIIREIGRGGMGIVYEAEQQTLRRHVAIKVLPVQTFRDSRQLDRFRIEAQASARLHHTNIVPVFGIGEDQGVHYYVMQFIRGQTLAEVLHEVRRLRAKASGAPAPAEEAREPAATVARSLLVEEFPQPAPAGDAAAARSAAGSPPPPAAPRAASSDSSSSLSKDLSGVYYQSIARIALQVAEALAYAHNAGILHRDIKPSNLLLDVKGTVWITDFGLAKIQDSAELTATGGLVGTMRYMAPERFQGKDDARCDIYGLGVTLYELLTLRPAFPSNDRAEVLREVTRSQRLPPRKIDPAIPRDLETIVLKAMAREPKDRYAGAAQLADDLRRFLSFEPVSARRASPVERLWRWCQREPTMAALTGVSLMLLIALAVGSMVHTVRLGVERNRTAERLVVSKLQEGRAWRLSREGGSRQHSLAALREAVTPATAPEVRNEVLGSLALVELVETAKYEDLANRWTTDPEVKRSARIAEDGSIRVFAGVSRDVIADLPGDSRPINFVVLSPGGKYLAACHEKAAWLLWDVDRQERLQEWKMRTGPTRAAFDASARRFAHMDEDGSLVIRDLPEGRVAQRLDVISAPEGLAFDGSGRRLALSGFLANHSLAVIYDLQTGAVLSHLYHPGFSWAVAWHPDDRRLAVACADYNVYVWDTDSGKRLLCLKGHAAEVINVCFGEGGTLLASGGWDNRSLIWHTDTGTLLTEAAGDLLAFTPADRRLAYSWRDFQGGLGEWRIEGGDICRILHAPMIDKGPREIAVSPDGRWLAAACYDEGLRVWCLDQPTESMRIDAGLVRSVCFQPDGSALWLGTDDGLYRWPLRPVEGTNEWLLGPPEAVAKGPTRVITFTADGRRAAMAAGDGRLVIRDTAAEGAVLMSFTHPEAARCMISASGRWLVSSTFHGEDVRVWNTSTGTVEQSFPVGTAKAAFSPDERWLAVVNSLEVAVYQAGTWREHFRQSREGAGSLGGPLTFSPDGRYFAFGRSFTALSLLRLEDGEELARLEGPTGAQELYELRFSPDQRLLIAAVPQAVHIWDLSLMRRELSALDLDWSSAETVPAAQRAEHLRLRVDSRGLPPPGLVPRIHHAGVSKLLDLHSQRIFLDPSPEAHLARAVALERYGDWSGALADIDQALAGSRADARTLILRASVLGRLGRGEEAMKDCDRALALCCRPAPAPDEHRNSCPIFREARRVQARIQVSLGAEHLESALRDWLEILGLEPEDREARENIPWLFVLQCCEDRGPATGKASELSTLALACAERNRSAAPEDPKALGDLGALQYHLGRLEEAEPLLAKAWSLNDGMVSAAFHLAMVHHRRGEADKARSVFQAAATAQQTASAPPATPGELLGLIRSFAQKVLAAPPGSSLE